MTVTNPAVYRIDIHAHHPWLVVMQPLGFRVRRNSLRNLYADSRAARPAGRAKLRSGAGGREILGSQDHRTVSLPSTAAPAPLRRTVIPRSSLRDPSLQAERVCYAPKAPAPLREDGHVLGPLSRTQLPSAAPARLVHARIALRIAPISCLYARRQYGGTRPSMPAVVFR